MILSVSRRSDVPALHCDWFFERLRAGEVIVPNPFIDGGKASRVPLVPLRIERNVFGTVETYGNLEGIMFWTKNPASMLARLDELGEIPYYFQFTLNPYGEKYEMNLPPLTERIDSFVALAKRCPVIWRYDPIFVGKGMDVGWHIEQFSRLARALKGSAYTCVINTLNGRFSDIFCPSAVEVREIVAGLVEVGQENGMEIRSCAEIINLENLGVRGAICLDPAIFERLIGFEVKKTKVKGANRKGCNCMESIDIGAYNTCSNGCVYCYAQKSTLSPKAPSEIYTRKTELVFNYSKPIKEG